MEQATQLYNPHLQEGFKPTSCHGEQRLLPSLIKGERRTLPALKDWKLRFLGDRPPCGILDLSYPLLRPSFILRPLAYGQAQGASRLRRDSRNASLEAEGKGFCLKAEGRSSRERLFPILKVPDRSLRPKGPVLSSLLAQNLETSTAPVAGIV